MAERPTPLLRRTKIVATVGPATDSLDVLTEMMHAGLDVVRLNASHGTVADRRRRLSLVREAAHRADKCIGVLLFHACKRGFEVGGNTRLRAH